MKRHCSVVGYSINSTAVKPVSRSAPPELNARSKADEQPTRDIKIKLINE